MEERAQILETGIPLFFKAQIEIKAPAKKIFDFISNPANHRLMDGSGTVKGAISGPDRLFLGARFGMAMKIKVPYRIKNTVVEFEENKKITWCHLMKWTWCYELQAVTPNQTIVTESFDASKIPAFSAWWLRRTGALKRNPKWMAKSLVALKAICEG